MSVAAFQFRVTSSLVRDAVRPVTVDGRLRVAAPALTCTILLTDGTPFSSIRNAMYQPGGATFALAGPSTCTPPEIAVVLSFRKRWSMSKLCVTEPIRTSETERMRAASGVSG